MGYKPYLLGCGVWNSQLELDSHLVIALDPELLVDPSKHYNTFKIGKYFKFKNLYRLLKKPDNFCLV